MKIELLELLEEKKRRQEVELARQAGAIVVKNLDGSATLIRLKFVEAKNGWPASESP